MSTRACVFVETIEFAYLRSLLQYLITFESVIWKNDKKRGSYIAERRNNSKYEFILFRNISIRGWKPSLRLSHCLGKC